MGSLCFVKKEQLEATTPYVRRGEPQSSSNLPGRPRGPVTPGSPSSPGNPSRPLDPISPGLPGKP